MPTKQLGFNHLDQLNPLSNFALKNSSRDIQNEVAPSISKKKLRYGAHKGVNVKPTFISFNSQNKSNRQNLQTSLTGTNQSAVIDIPNIFYKNANEGGDP
jgi:hypothetical protein